jgi:hypothetical protein
LYYFLSITFSLYRLVIAALDDPSEPNWAWVYGAAGAYAIATIWGVSTLLHHWRALISPPRAPKGS